MSNEATARPWRAYHRNDGHWFVAEDTGETAAYGKHITGWGRVEQREADANLIVTAVNERDALLAEVGRLREALEQLGRENERLQRVITNTALDVDCAF